MVCIRVVDPIACEVVKGRVNKEHQKFYLFHIFKVHLNEPPVQNGVPRWKRYMVKLVLLGWASAGPVVYFLLQSSGWT